MVADFRLNIMINGGLFTMSDFTAKAFEERLGRIRQEVQSFFEHFVTEDELDVFSPKADFVQVPSGFEVRLDLPGMTRQDIKVELADALLTVKGERATGDAQDEETSWLRRERHYGRFSRTFPIPVPVTKSDITARFRDGVLTVTIKTTEHPPEDPSITID